MGLRRLLIAILITLGATSAPATAFAADDAVARAADRYLAAVPMRSMLDDMVNELSSQVDPEKREVFVAEMRALLRAERLEQIARESMVQIFTADELNALADFYTSEAGQGVLRKFGAYMGQIMPAIQQEIRDALQTMQTAPR